MKWYKLDKIKIKGVDGKDGSPDTPKEIVDKLDTQRRSQKLQRLINDLAKPKAGGARQYTSSEFTATSSTWGDITGTLSDQTDLQSALDAKADSDDIVADHGELTGLADDDHAQYSKITVDTRANILALTHRSGAIAYATDTQQFLVDDGTDWLEIPLELDESNGPDMGAYFTDNGDHTGLGVSSRSDYYRDTVSGKVLANVYLTDTTDTNEGQLRINNSTYQIYLNSQWNDIVINFRFREDDTGSYELENKPQGLALWYEVLSGNSDQLGVNGLPLVQNYAASMGAYPRRLAVGGSTF